MIFIVSIAAGREAVDHPPVQGRLLESWPDPARITGMSKPFRPQRQSKSGWSCPRVSILTLPRLGAQPEFVPVVVSTRLIQRTEVGKALMSPRLTWPLEATLVLPTA